MIISVVNINKYCVSSYNIYTSVNIIFDIFCICLQVVTPTTTIVLNAVDLSIKSAIVKIGENEQTANDITFEASQETVTLTFPNELVTGEGQLEILFSGTLNDKMKGFYRSKYYTATGEERYGGVTQLYVCICNAIQILIFG